MQRLLDANLDLTSRNNNGNLLLHDALSGGSVAITKMLLHAGVTHLAIGSGELVELVLGAGADISAVADGGTTVLQLAAGWVAGAAPELCGCSSWLCMKIPSALDIQ